MTTNRTLATLAALITSLSASSVLAVELNPISVTGNVGFTVEHSGTNNYVGNSPHTIIGDFDGDGFDDIVFTLQDPLNTVAERAFLIYGAGNTAALENFDVSTLAAGDGSIGLAISLSSTSSLSIAGGGDINGDGREDLIIGERSGADSVSGNAAVGKTYAVFGQAGRSTTSIDLDSFETSDGSLGFVIIGKDSGDASGASVANAGDFNNDGFDDILIGAPGAFGNLANTFLLGAGEAYVVYSPGAALVSSIRLDDIANGDGSAGIVAYGGFTDAASGNSVAGLGDVNGDGISDVAIGSPTYAAQAGRTYVMFGGNSSASIELDALSNATGFKVDGAADFTTAGTVSSLGDYNGDGFNDLLIGAQGRGLTEDRPGSAYVVFGSNANDRELVRLSDVVAGDNTNGFRITLNSATMANFLGIRVAGPGDVNGDGMTDLMIVAPVVLIDDLDTPTNPAVNGTVTFITYGDANATTNMNLDSIRTGATGLFITGDSSGDISFDIGAGGDVNGDGVNDFLVGSGSSVPGEFFGKSHIVFGSANLPPRIGKLVGTNGASTLNIPANDNGPGLTLSFTVEDMETPADSLLVTATSSDETVIAPAGIVLGGSASDRTVTFQALPGQAGETVLTVSVEDSGGSAALRQITINVQDLDSPEITLLGDNPQLVTPGTAYVEAGATANDAVDGDVSADIVIDASQVDTATPGSYTVTYTVTDSSGQTASAVRTVEVTQFPTISAIADMQVTTDGQIEFSIVVADMETPADQLQVDITNLSAGTVDVSEAIVLANTMDATMRTVRVIPDPTSVGDATLELSVVDAEGAGVSTTFVLTISDGQAPEISLNGDDPLVINPGESYTDPGAMAMDLVDGDLNANIVVGGDVVDANSPGSYVVTYTVQDAAGNQAQVERSVVVSNPPVISAIASITIAPNQRSGDITFTASDVETAGDDLVITATSSDVMLLDEMLIEFGGSGNARLLTVQPADGQLGTATVTVTVTDSDGAQATQQFDVTVADQEGPTITLNGSSTVSLNVGQTYNELGATANDQFDGDISADIVTSGTVDTSTAGQYTVSYTVMDSSGNATVVTRTVSVTMTTTTPPVVTPPSSGGGGGGGSLGVVGLLSLMFIALRRRATLRRIQIR